MPVTVQFPSIDPSVATALGLDYRVKQVNFGDGYSQRVADGLNARQENWRVVWDNISDANKTTIESFFDARGGSAEPFLWTPPRGTEKQFLAKDIKIIPLNYLTWTIEARFEESFDL